MMVIRGGLWLAKANPYSEEVLIQVTSKCYPFHDGRKLIKQLPPSRLIPPEIGATQKS